MFKHVGHPLELLDNFQVLGTGPLTLATGNAGRGGGALGAQLPVLLLVGKPRLAQTLIMMSGYLMWLSYKMLSESHCYKFIIC